MKSGVKKIYLVGYPKSGTTWLIKLMAHVLNIPVKNKKNAKVPPQEINQRLDLGNTHSFITKSHDLPIEFFQKVDASPERIIHIYRDFKATFISAFFYFTIPKRYAFLFLLENDPKLSYPKQLLRFVLFPFSRWYLGKALKKYIEYGVTDGSLGTWDQHLNEWKQKAVGKQNTCLFTFVEYEALLEKPEESIKQIIVTLDLPVPEDSWISTVVKEESFEKMKSRLTADSNPTEVSKLRTGKKDDWRNYLSHQNLRLIANSGIEKLD